MNITEIRIGRNIGNVPMPAVDWQRFIDEARTDLVDFAKDIQAENYWTEVHTGTGTFEGISEDSAIITLYWDNGNPTPARVEHAHNQLTDHLIWLAAWYHQKAVAAVHGTSTLVSAEVSA